MSESTFFLAQNGQQVQQGDFATLGTTSGLADDRALSDLLRLVPYSGTVAKAVLPYRYKNITGDATVTPGTGGVTINPFRAIVGSRTAVGTDALASWRDIRSAVFVGGATSLTKAQGLANGPGTPGEYRWDLVYAAVSPDTNGATVSRLVKDPTTKVVAAQTVSTTKSTTCTIGVVQGAASATPAFPTITADSGGTYYIPLAYVLIANGFGLSSVVSPADIYDIAPVVHGGAALGQTTIQPADGQYLETGPVQTGPMAWTIGAAGRSPVYMPPSMTGGTSLLIAMDLTPSSGAAWSHPTGSVIDSRDWRYRMFKWTAYVQNYAIGSGFAFSTVAGSGRVTPNARVENYTPATVKTTAPVAGFGQSFVDDSSGGNSTLGDDFNPANLPVAANQSVVVALTNANLSTLVSGVSPFEDTNATVSIYCDRADSGKLKLSVHGSPRCRIFIWLECTAPFPNPGY